jgi:Homeodomain-like domain
MKDEFSDRHQAIRLQLAGQTVESICRTLGRSHEWFHAWWRRYQAAGADSLYDLTRANRQPPRIAPKLERTIIGIRRRLESPIHPLPCVRTIERVLQRNGLTLPRVRLAHLLPTHVYPTPPAHDSNQLHQLDLVRPIYLKGQRQRYYIFKGSKAIAR